MGWIGKLAFYCGQTSMASSVDISQGRPFSDHEISKAVKFRSSSCAHCFQRAWLAGVFSTDRLFWMSLNFLAVLE
jgi:hypothetical protein